MTRLFVNGAAASAGGGLTYLRNVIPQLAQQKDVQATVAINKAYLGQLPQPANIAFIESDSKYGAAGRFLWEQSALRAEILASRADVLLSAGNFAIRKCPVPQVLLSGNSLYISKDFRADLRKRHEYGTLVGHNIRTFLAKRSVSWADCTVAPSESFADDLRRWTGANNIQAVHHGFDHEIFFCDQEALPVEIQNKLNVFPQALRLLFVSPYNYYRNFETLFRALPLIRNKTGRDVKLFLTCRLQPNDNPGSYNVNRAVALIENLGIGDDIVELGAIPNHHLHHVYRACQIYVTASYAETFAHPLVEAMSCGLPIIASNLPVHREVCEAAAVYFDGFSPQELAQRVADVAGNAGVSEQMSIAGQARARDFSWKKHTEELLAIFRALIARASYR
jgi:glycosyltransferase involved in cell wall biosynthesis